MDTDMEALRIYDRNIAGRILASVLGRKYCSHNILT